MKSPVARDAYLQAEIITALTHQIRAIRTQRGWTQRDLAKKLGTTQAAVSRLEDPSYGRFSIGTLMELAKVFDVGLQVKFVSFVTMLEQTFKPKHEDRMVPAFEDEAPYVSFFTESFGDQFRFNRSLPSAFGSTTMPELSVPSTGQHNQITVDVKPTTSAFISVATWEPRYVGTN